MLASFFPPTVKLAAHSLTDDFSAYKRSVIFAWCVQCAGDRKSLELNV